MGLTKGNVLAKQATLFYTGPDRTQIPVLVITQNVGSPQLVEATPSSGVRRDLGNHQSQLGVGECCSLARCSNEMGVTKIGWSPL
jgi:hypothetical protein